MKLSSWLPRIVRLKLELSLVENYRGECLLTKMLPCLYDEGFRTVAIEPGWSNPVTREVFPVDLTCFRVERTCVQAATTDR
jgi:hypothetical protein